MSTHPRLRSRFATALTPPWQTAFTLTDPGFGQQWYLLNTGQTGGIPGVDLNVTNVWADYTGNGVTVGVVDDGVDYAHPDLDGNYDPTRDFDAAEGDNDAAPTYPSDGHGTSVAGIIAAEAGNGQGGVGVAPDATLAGLRLDFTGAVGEQAIATTLEQFAAFDVVNNSWGYFVAFADDFGDAFYQSYETALQTAVTMGRNGLGTVVVFAAGNSRQSGDNTNYHNLNNSRLTISVAALTHAGVHTYYSTPGASVLVSAFGGGAGSDGIFSTDRVGAAGYDVSNYTNQFGGTSSAAPMVSGVVALMLDANPNLGYRDVQEILAYSARQTDVTHRGWRVNGATNWNGGGLHVSHDYGFGLVDAHAAVRLAETWAVQQTALNEQAITVTRSPGVLIPDGSQVSDTVNLTTGLLLDQVEVEVDIAHTWIGDLEIVLTSPDGTESLLVNRPGATPSTPFGVSSDNLRFTLSSTHYWGETGIGTWSLTVRDRATSDVGTLNRWTLRLYGDALSENDTYIYTNEFAQVWNEGDRQTLSDGAGIDTLNVAAITSNSLINLAPGEVSILAGRPLLVRTDTLIEHAVGGDGDDRLTGNGLGNSLYGMRGDDLLWGMTGADRLDGHRGNDLLDGGADNDLLLGGQGLDRLVGGAGDDTLTGGVGGDRFRFVTGAAFAPAALGIDLITDFTTALDKVVLSRTTFAALTSQLGAGFSVADEFASVANDGGVARSMALVVYSRATGNLFYNQNRSANGLGLGIQFATLAGRAPLSAQDFVIQA